MNIVVFTGAGISAESGIQTFRDTNGLWNNHSVEEVATPAGFKKNPELVLNFYNERRRDLLKVKPNNAHFALAELENKFDVHIITQNVDDLHERAGSTKVLHLHGELLKMRSTGDSSLILPITEDIKVGDKCPKGFQLRPHIVWFTEQVPNMGTAHEITESADIFIVVGTSLKVYPAATLLESVTFQKPIYFIDPNATKIDGIPNVKYIKKKASTGVTELVNKLMK